MRSPADRANLYVHKRDQLSEASTMTVRTILAPLSGGAASEGAVETACRLAQRFAAHLEVLHVRADPRDTLPLLGQDISAPVAGELIELATRESAETAAKAKAIFDAAVTRHGIALRETPGNLGQAAAGAISAAWREELGHAPVVVARRARLNDLVVLGQSGRVQDKPHTDTLEEVVTRGGRPVLLAPARPGAPIGEVVAVAWNASPEAARAVGAALPFLSRASEVHVLTAGDKDDAPADAELAAYLAWHGISAVPHGVHKLDGVGTGELLLAAARDAGADLLVMGGYGHAPWREMIFGGATRQVVGTSRLPILLAH
jgi:nucleotide-binding universal stress UspA family protein